MEDGEAADPWGAVNVAELADILGVPLPEDMSIEDLAMSLAVVEMGSDDAS